MRGVFVTGTDTGVGKTWVSRALLKGLNQRGSAVGMKPVASGCERGPEGLRNEDALGLIAESVPRPDYPLVNPYAFAPPIAPHLAALESGQRIAIEVILERYHALARLADRVVVEGVGGWLVPLQEGGPTVADLAVALGLPVVLVVGLRLGCINHALLTAEAIRGRRLPLVGWVANRIDPAMTRPEANIQTLATHLGAPLLGVVPHLPAWDAATVAASLDLGPLWRD